MNSKRLNSLQGLRFLCFLQIFITHTCILDGNPSAVWLSLVPWALELFMILSGFGMGLGYSGKVTNYCVSLKEMFNFSKGKTKKIFPLHILTLLISLIYIALQVVVSKTRFNIRTGVIAFISQLFLFQSWIPSAEIRRMYNAPTWFLCDIVFCYFLTIPLLKFLNRLKKTNIYVLLIGILSIRVIMAVAFNTNEFWVHIFPLSRLLDYFLGLLGSRILASDDRLKTFPTSKASFVQLGTTLLLIIAIFYCSLFYQNNNANTFTKIIHPDGILMIPCFLFILSIARENGLLSKIMSWKPFVSLGNISMEFYLLHYIIIMFTWSFFSAINIPLNIGIVCLEFVLSLSASYIYNYLAKRYKEKH